MRPLFAAAIAFAMALILSGCITPRPRAEVQIPTTVKTAAAQAGSSDQAKGEWETWDVEGPRRLRSSVGGYFKNRCLDFMDMIDVGISGGKSFKIQADYLIGFYGFGATDAQRWRFGQRSTVADEKTTTACALPFPASLILFPIIYAFPEEAEDVDQTVGSTNQPRPSPRMVPIILTLGGVAYESEHAIWPNAATRGIPNDLQRIRMMCIERDVDTHEFVVTPESFAVGAEVDLFIGARARVYPIQIADFITGIFGWDLAGDDVQPVMP